ncbi:hypothetical protein MKZ38_007966 [Zalerion maritima]|uniref:Uncharacterized protein n=1 Tax=Zalerion maritima TaxID=339359 RepID=A0AAD5RH58_9PEZI|nr:hypothetical protein MKZ38_007966 [Zalerion maritima]
MLVGVVDPTPGGSVLKFGKSNKWYARGGHARNQTGRWEREPRHEFRGPGRSVRAETTGAAGSVRKRRGVCVRWKDWKPGACGAKVWAADAGLLEALATARSIVDQHLLVPDSKTRSVRLQLPDGAKMAFEWDIILPSALS